MKTIGDFARGGRQQRPQSFSLQKSLFEMPNVTGAASKEQIIQLVDQFEDAYIVLK